MPDFTSVDPDHPPQSSSTVFKWAVLDRLLGRRERPAPGPPAPRIELDLERLSSPAQDQVWWLGHASFLVQLAGHSVLIDPVLGGRLGLVFPRYQAPALGPAQLPRIDLLLISHGHRDHLDEWTIRRLDRGTPTVVPSGLAHWFQARGFTNVKELEWWQSTNVEKLEVTLVPARHWSRRGLGDLNATLWGGLVIKAQNGACVYHAGDSAYWSGFGEIGARFPQLDVALLPIGAYSPAWFMEHSHMNPEQAGQAFLDLGARRMIPMHWGTFRLTDERLREPIERLESWWQRQQPAGSLHQLAVGESLELPDASELS